MNLYHDLDSYAEIARLERLMEAKDRLIDAQSRHIDLLQALIEVKYAPREVEHYPTVDLWVSEEGAPAIVHPVEDCR